MICHSDYFGIKKKPYLCQHIKAVQASMRLLHQECGSQSHEILWKDLCLEANTNYILPQKPQPNCSNIVLGLSKFCTVIRKCMKPCYEDLFFHFQILGLVLMKFTSKTICKKKKWDLKTGTKVVPNETLKKFFLRSIMINKLDEVLKGMKVGPSWTQNI